MTLPYVVGIRIGNKADQISVEAEDALIAALRVKAVHPDAAVRLRLEAWRPLLEGPAWLELLLPILVHTPDPAIEARITRLPAEAKQHLAEAYRHIPTAVAALREHFLPARLVAATTSSRIH